MSLKRTRPIDRPYEVWSGGGWTWKVLKFYKSYENTINDPYGRVFCEVDGFEKELGDVYYSDIRNNADLISSDYGE
jgi:hypothetical protein